MSERNQQEHAHAHTHEHGHGHGHGHSHAHQDVETLNVDHFNKTANTYEDNSHVRELTAKYGGLSMKYCADLTFVHL